MRKIISVLVGLGLTVALSMFAVPTAAQQAPCGTVTLSSPCELTGGITYTVTFTAPATLLPGNDLIALNFGVGTTNGTFATGDITVNGANVTVSSAKATGTHMEFPTPVQLNAGTSVTVVIGKMKNAAAGDYNLCLDYKLACCPTVPNFCCIKYTIGPLYTKYGFVWDSGPTYPGIAADFVPPFGVGEMHGFNLTFQPYSQGCNALCASPVDIVMSLVSWPQFPCADLDAVAKVTLNLTGPAGTWAGVLPLNKCEDGEPLEVTIYDDMPLAANTTYTWQGLIQFDTVGEYTICFKVVCPGVEPGPCTPPAAPGEENILFQKCFGSDTDRRSDAEAEEGYCSANQTGDVDTGADTTDASTTNTVADVESATTANTVEEDHEITADSEAAPLGGCFIATAAYGTPMAEEIQILRRFRDEYLLTNPVGGALVDFYYMVSPPIAEFITKHPSLKAIVRTGLVPAVVMSTIAVNITPAQMATIIGLLVLVAVALDVWTMRRRGSTCSSDST